jgi:hypothetical protein
MEEANYLILIVHFSGILTIRRSIRVQFDYLFQLGVVSFEPPLPQENQEILFGFY